VSGAGPRPASRDQAAASARSATPSFVRTPDLWLLTVFGERPSRAVAAAGRAAQHPADHPGAEDRLADGHRPDRADDLVSCTSAANPFGTHSFKVEGCDTGAFGHTCRQGWTVSVRTNPY